MVRSVRMIVYITNFPKYQASRFPLNEDDTKATGIQLAIHPPGTKPNMEMSFSFFFINIFLDYIQHTRCHEMLESGN